MSTEHRRREGEPLVRSETSKLAELRGHEERLEALHAQRTDLEVERIVAATASRSAKWRRARNRPCGSRSSSMRMPPGSICT